MVSVHARRITESSFRKLLYDRQHPPPSHASQKILTPKNAPIGVAWRTHAAPRTGPPTPRALTAQGEPLEAAP